MYVCKAYEAFYKNATPVPIKSLREMLKLTLQKNSFQFNLETHGAAMGTKVALAFTNILLPNVESEIIRARLNSSSGKDTLTTSSSQKPQSLKAKDSTKTLPLPTARI